MKVTLTHDGKSVELDLTAKQMTALGLKEEKKKTGYERRIGHYYVNAFGSVVMTCAVDDLDYDAANHYTNEKLAEANARADRLMRQLRRFAAENGGIPSVEDNKNCANRTIICYNYYTGELVAESRHYTSMSVGCVSFVSYMAADLAIEKFHDELIWYFTEYEAMLR